jgi:hypothetical protein
MNDRPKTNHTAFLREDIPAEIMAKLKASYCALGRGPTKGCPDPETVIAYALEDLIPERRAQVHAHLSECKECLDLVLDLRSAWAEAQEKRKEIREGTPISIRVQSWVARLVERVKEWISHLTPLPRLVPAAVAFVVLAVVSLGVYQHLTTPISIQLDLISLDSGLLTRGPSEGRKISVPKGGVLRSGDRFQIVLETNKDAYVYVFFRDTTGKITNLYSGKVLGNKLHKLPSEKLDEKTGQEEVIVMASKSPVSNPDEVARQLKKVGIDGLRNLHPQSNFQSFSFKHE